MSKRTWIAVIALVASLLIAATGTLAYLTDTDSDVNVMTLGNVDIEQHEMKRKDGIKYNATLQDGDLEPFTDGIKLYPAYPVNGAVSDYTAAPVGDMLMWGPYVHTGTAGNGLWNDAKLVGAVDKMVFVENTGDSPAFFRTLIAYECPDGVEIGEPSQGAHIMINVNGSETMYNPPKSRFAATIDVGGVQYVVFEYIYQDALLPGEWSHPSLLQVVMTHNATNETVELLGETYEILALSQAVQVENLEQLGAEKALDAAFGDVDVANATTWFSEMEGMPVQTASTADELAAALAEGGTVVLNSDIVLEDAISITEPATIALNGNTLTVSRLEAADDVNISGGKLVHGESDYPAVSVKGGSLTMDNVEIINDDKPCNVMTSGSLKAVESVALQIFEGDCVLNNCSIYIKHSEKVYASNVVGISVHDGTLTMNGGSITVESAGATNSKYFNDAALCAGSAAQKAFTLNNVSLSVGDAYNLYVFNNESAESVVVNTTDAAGSWDGKVYGNATINYNYTGG